MAEGLCPGLFGHLLREEETCPGDEFYPATQTRPPGPNTASELHHSQSGLTQHLDGACPVHLALAPKFMESVLPPAPEAGLSCDQLAQRPELPSEEWA